VHAFMEATLAVAQLVLGMVVTLPDGHDGTIPARPFMFKRGGSVGVYNADRTLCGN
jgi:hypothetical protein